MDTFAKTNQSLWNGWADINSKSAFYDLDGFRAGATSLEPLEREQLGDVAHDSYEWHHGVGDIVTALIDAGLRLEFLHEHAYSSYGCFPFAEEVSPDRWEVRGLEVPVPLMFSLCASSPDSDGPRSAHQAST